MRQPRWYEVFMWRIGLRICPYCDGIGFTYETAQTNFRFRKLCEYCGGFKEAR